MDLPPFFPLPLGGGAPTRGGGPLLLLTAAFVSTGEVRPIGEELFLPGGGAPPRVWGVGIGGAREAIF